jgi:Cu/Ag efflux protein CusF
MRDKSRARALIATAALSVIVLAVTPNTGLAKSRFTYSGKTDQESVSTTFRKLEFKIKKGKVTLTTEPVVNRDLCVSTPVFTLDGDPVKPLSKRGGFTFTKTFQGNKIDKISGRFTSPKKIEGFAIYHFFGSDLCSEGKTKVKFEATRGGKSKKKK